MKKLEDKIDKTKLEVPRLPQEIKNLNGKSGKRLSRCIDDLCEVLSDEEKEKKDVKKD